MTFVRRYRRFLLVAGVGTVLSACVLGPLLVWGTLQEAVAVTALSKALGAPVEAEWSSAFWRPRIEALRIYAPEAPDEPVIRITGLALEITPMDERPILGIHAEEVDLL